MKVVYGLALSHVKGNVDSPVIVAVFPTLEEGKAWEKGERAPEEYKSDPQEDAFGRVHPYHLTYKPGSPIQWYNPPNFEPNGWKKLPVEDDFDCEAWNEHAVMQRG